MIKTRYNITNPTPKRQNRLVDMLPCQMKPTLIRAPPVINGYSTQTTDGKNVAQYEAVFLQLADEHRTVNAFELHELLEACLPNGNATLFAPLLLKFIPHVFQLLLIDYIKSCANLDVCRQLVLVFDVII